MPEGVSFNEDDNLGLPKQVMRQKSLKAGGLSGFIMKLGLAQDQKQAEVILLVVLVVCLALTAYVFMSGGGATTPHYKYDPTDPAVKSMTVKPNQ